MLWRSESVPGNLTSRQHTYCNIIATVGVDISFKVRNYVYLHQYLHLSNSLVKVNNTQQWANGKTFPTFK